MFFPRPRNPLMWSGLVALLALGACARSGPPAPVYTRDHPQPAQPAERHAALPPETAPPQTSPSPPPPVAAVPRSGRSVVVKPGDTLYSIARDNGVPLRALIDTNRLGAPFALSPGQRLDLPVARYHIARRGESLYGIARKYNVDMRALVRANNIDPPYVITVGRKIVLPDSGGTAVAARADAASDAAPPAAPRSRPPVATDTLPPPASAAPSTDDAAETAPERQVAARQPAPPASSMEPPPREGSRFLWPLRGKILVGFGPRGGGLHNDGINIAASEGEAIRAAEAGVVVYAGNELQGFGNLVLLRHAGDWMTAYAHASAILVKRGDVVRRGQVIARAGRTGNVSRTQLHFEIRRNDKAVDPMRYLSDVAVRGDAKPIATTLRAGRRDPG